MPKSLDHEIYQDKTIRCRKVGCRKFIGEQRLNGQILILESGLIIFNYLCWKCECNRASSWLAPALPNDKPTLNNQVPDIGEIQTKALFVKENFGKLADKSKGNQADYRPKENRQTA